MNLLRREPCEHTQVRTRGHVTTWRLAQARERGRLLPAARAFAGVRIDPFGHNGPENVQYGEGGWDKKLGAS